MPRRPRRNVDTSFLHVIVQGIDKKYIFNSKKSIEIYIKIMLEGLEKYKLKLIAYCVMNNHAHMLFYVENVNELSQYMKYINVKYSRYFNKKEKRVGYVFRDRFLSQPIYNQKYLYKCVAYIHMNPVKAQIVSEPGNYPYSSYSDFIAKNGIVDEAIINILFGSIDNYIEMFKFIHYEAYDEDYSDYTKKEVLDDDYIIQMANYYAQEMFLDFSEIRNDNKILRRVWKNLNNKGLSNRRIEKALGMCRKRIERLDKK
jgi:REP element-mobilizing transposase RayT